MYLVWSHSLNAITTSRFSNVDVKACSSKSIKAFATKLQLARPRQQP